jgi:choice-of-anchor A domain-containing protein
VVVFGTFVDNCCDVGGAVAAESTVGTSASSLAIASSLLGESLSNFSGNNDTLVTGGGVTGSGNYQLYAGNAYSHSTSHITFNGTDSGGSVSTGSDPIDFSTLQSSMQTESANINTMATSASGISCTSGSGSVEQTAAGSCMTYGSYGVEFTGTAGQTDYFNISGSYLASGYTIDVYTNGGTVIVNVTGTLNTTSSAMYVNGSGANGDQTTTAAEDVLFNYAGTHQVTLNTSFMGSLLAPKAAVLGTDNLQFDGNLVAASFSGDTEFHNLLFEGGEEVPEPVSMFLIGSGLILLAWIGRRKRLSRGARR